MLSFTKSRLAGKSFLQTLFFFLLVTQICFAQWYQQNSGTDKNLSAVQFIDANNGFAVGDSGIILQTSDGGVTWLQQTSGIISNVNDVKFVNATTGFAVCDSGIILKTTDGGQNWLQQSSGTSYELNAVTFIDDNSGWVVGGEHNLGFWGIILRTIDGGINWSAQDEGIILYDVYFRDENNGMAVGLGEGPAPTVGDVLKTTDGGNTWTSQYYASPAFHGVAYAGGNVWCAVGVSGGLKYSWGNISISYDDGISWNDANFPSTWGGFDDVTFVNNNIGWVVGLGIDTLWNEFAAILFTEDGGTTWTRQESGTTNTLHSIFFTDLNNGWTVGDNGKILHTTNGGVSFVEEEQINELPTKFLLSQNYPNPFNPITKIKYSIPPVGTQRAVSVQIKVFDVLGNEIETLVNEEKPAGTYELTWYATNLPSGVYFYQLKAGNFVQTKKMLLLK